MESDTVRPRWITWPAAAVAAVGWGLDRLTHVALFGVIVVAALAGLGGWLLTAVACRYLVRTRQHPPGTAEAGNSTSGLDPAG